MAGFSFGAPAPVAGGAPAPAAGGFSFGAPAPAAGAPAPAASAPAFSFGAPAPAAAKPGAAAPTAPSFSFGAPAPAAAPIPAAPVPAPAAAPAAGGFGFGAAVPAAAVKPAAPAFGFGAAAPAAAKPASSTPAAPAFGFGAAAPASAPVASSGDGKRTKPTQISPTPPAAPAFGFGAPAAAAPTGGTTPKPPGISFGAPTPAPAAGNAATTTPTAASTTGGVSFSGAAASTPTPATPAGVQTPGAPAPVATPNPAAAVGTPAAASAPTPAPVAPREPPPLHYQTLTVEETLNMFQRQLEEDALAFLEEAKRVCEYDAILRDSQRDLAKLTTEAQRQMIEQEQIEKGLDGIGAFQNQLESTLTEVEEQVDTIFRSQGHLNPIDADKAREEAYNVAKGVEYRLENVTESLRETFETLNQANARAFGPPSSGDFSGDHSAVATGGDIVHILNRHQDALAELEAAAQKLELDCGEVHAALATTRR